MIEFMAIHTATKLMPMYKHILHDRMYMVMQRKQTVKGMRSHGGTLRKIENIK